MLKLITIKTLLIAVVLTSCKTVEKDENPVWHNLPEITDLSSLQQTEFVVTLENPVTRSKNTIYAPAFLFAWQKITEALKSPVHIEEKNSADFRLLATSTSHKNSLTEDEYFATATILDGEITARAFFNKTLPFETKLQLLGQPILFNKNSNVEAFGMHYFDNEIIKFTRILYYRNDENFIIQFTPKDKQHEILLIKGIKTYNTLENAIKQTTVLLEQGKKEGNDTNQSWKYNIIDGDFLAVPTIKFNIATNYKNLEGQQFITKDKKEHIINEAYQRTGFILNESGAVIESEALLVTDSVAIAPIKKQPKKLVFDTSFFVIIKHKEQANPYFVMAINNTELLTKKQ